MRILVCCTSYPDLYGNVSMMYVHTRSIFYKLNGIDITVLNFNCKKGYVIDGIQVISLMEYKSQDCFYDVLVCHAPNVRQHYRFLRRYEKRFNKIIFFFHGHEVLFKSKTYPKPYSYIHESKVYKIFNDGYDAIKLKLWHRYFPKLAEKSYYVFVSNWMLEEFKKWLKLKEEDLLNHILITYNGIGRDFENLCYNKKSEKQYDFVTIRSNLDGSKYAVDLVCKLAELNPQYKFVLVGKGNFFKYNKKPENMVWIKGSFSHEQIIELLDSSRVALMPTRTDAQGLMACEMASYGIPLITSDIPVCHEIFGDFSNVEYIRNDLKGIDLEVLFNRLVNLETNVNTRYYVKNTIENEVDLLNKISKSE